MFNMSSGTTVLKSSRPARKIQMWQNCRSYPAILGRTRFVEDLLHLFTKAVHWQIKGEMARGRSYPEYLIAMSHAGLNKDKTLNTLGKVI